MKGTGFPIRVLDMDSPFMFGLVRGGTPEEREECKAHGRPEDLPVSLLGLDKEGCACVDGKEVAARLADCWNACAGMENPADEIARLQRVDAASESELERIIQWMEDKGVSWLATLSDIKEARIAMQKGASVMGCQNCDGTGFYGSTSCGECRGTGHAKAEGRPQ